jgi:SAM-dependent methyltransferase
MKLLTFRRYYLDKYLSKESFSGRVLDIGGKKNNKRGLFTPPLSNIKSWEYLNIDKDTTPDYCCNVENIPVKDGTFDTVVMCEVLEHLETPSIALNECNRVLKDNGSLILSMPFLYAIHADPNDYQRWTGSKIRMELKKKGFEKIEIQTMGGLFAVIYDLMHVALNNESNSFGSLKNKLMRRVFMPILSKAFLYLDKIYIYKSTSMTTGYYINARKFTILE